MNASEPDDHFWDRPFKPSPQFHPNLNLYHLNLPPLSQPKEPSPTVFVSTPPLAMSDSDGEFELLDPNETVQAIGDHELKTSPLVTRDAIGFSEQFAQRGLLGTVLSVHANGLPGRTVDPRIYLNLDAPSSGLVCGVQGSGKSHTVSCILESSLMSSRRIGALPAPLGTVVFHFDEENGERPCEAAYLSELKDGSRGVEEVLVLVSPSNLRTRRRVYSSLKFVRVEPLRIAEQDLNATRMLSMMGADNLESLPLYMHTILSILREMGSDNFNYRDFQKRLKDPEFNKAQSAMLELRLDLLDSFLQGSGPDVKSFFKPGRLVILDISDPFVESTTAAMLFDICLGLFIEWKSSTGKLIVLDEAHKYLTNADANRFTKSICSIIRQQRHLAARVIVSTQEPTVVPASVLDLLSWIICHRFSSPGWVKHLKDHICAEEEDDYERTNGNSDWGKRVMMLRTGEALLYSPASLFATEEEEVVTLSAGYAIIKTRSRLTSDGGASLLATQTHDKSFVDTYANLPTPPSSDGLLPTTFPMSPRMFSSLIPPNTPLPRIIDLVASASYSVHAGVGFASALSPAPRSTVLPAFVPASQPPPPVVKKATPVSQPVMSPSPPNPPGGTGSGPSIAKSALNIAISQYSALIEVMRRLHQSGISQPDLCKIGEELSKSGKVHFTGKLKAYLEQAQMAGVLTVSGNGHDLTAKLIPTILASISVTHQAAQSKPNLPSSSLKPVPPAMMALLAVIAQLTGNPKGSARLTNISPLLQKHKDGDLKKAGYKKLKALADAAAERGLVTVTPGGGQYVVKVL